MSEYTCAACYGVFERVTSDEEAMAETRKLFGENVNQDDCVIVCDDCFKAMTCAYPPEQFLRDERRWVWLCAPLWREGWEWLVWGARKAWKRLTA